MILTHDRSAIVTKLYLMIEYGDIRAAYSIIEGMSREEAGEYSKVLGRMNNLFLSRTKDFK